MVVNTYFTTGPEGGFPGSFLLKLRPLTSVFHTKLWVKRYIGVNDGSSNSMQTLWVSRPQVTPDLSNERVVRLRLVCINSTCRSRARRAHVWEITGLILAWTLELENRTRSATEIHEMKRTVVVNRRVISNYGVLNMSPLLLQRSYRDLDLNELNPQAGTFRGLTSLDSL